ncbi:MAG TPA: hypothetical protein VMJ10_26720 [Kofleriaceae bacterium]|nr:hypothetical protein [Kofleriaceae bacterium]
MGLALALGAFACGTSSGSDADDNGVEAPDPAGKADGADKPLGTFTGQGAISSSAQLDELVIESNGNCFLVVEPCATGSCEPQPYFCSYKFTKSGSTRYIHLDQPADDVPGGVVRYAYTLDGDTLKVRPSGTSKHVSLDRVADHQWCEAVDDCSLQAYTCSKSWKCGAGDNDSGTCTCTDGPPNPCAAVGGSCVIPDDGECDSGQVSAITGCGVNEDHIGLECCLPKTANKCEVAGGSCVALAPGSCSGVIGDANTYGCGGGDGVECCLPATPKPGDKCNAAGGTCVPKSSEGDLCDIVEADDCSSSQCCL